MKPQNNLQKNVGITLGVVVIIGIFYVTIFWGKQTTPPSAPLLNQGGDGSGNSIPQNPQTPPVNTPSVPKVTPVVKTTPEYTLAQVATHSNSTSCWSVVNASVYDLTSWINSHPGGKQAIVSMCGKDATTAFENQHGGQRRPEQELASFFIGNYKK
jgi:cytochrome b involved in lipid metabolism